jgi:hypothetical protein
MRYLFVLSLSQQFKDKFEGEIDFKISLSHFFDGVGVDEGNQHRVVIEGDSDIRVVLFVDVEVKGRTEYRLTFRRPEYHLSQCFINHHSSIRKFDL